MNGVKPKESPPTRFEEPRATELPAELSPAFLFQVAARIDTRLARRDEATVPIVHLSRYIE